MEKIILNKKNGSKIEGKLKFLDISYIDKIMKLQEQVYNELEKKEFYFCSSKEEFIDIFNGKGRIVGCVTSDDELIAIGSYAEFGYDKSNYGYDVNIKGDELLKVGQLEATIVSSDYRGNRLQKKMCEMLEEIALVNKMKYICVTAAPDNIYSVNTIKNLGYKTILEKLKYGGLKRYVFMKKTEV